MGVDRTGPMSDVMDRKIGRAETTMWGSGSTVRQPQVEPEKAGEHWCILIAFIAREARHSRSYGSLMLSLHLMHRQA